MAKEMTLTGLTPNEINIGNGRMAKGGTGTDLETAITQGGPGRWYAMAVILWLYRRRSEPTASLDEILDTSADEIVVAMGIGDDDAPAAEGPTEPTP